MNNFMKKYLGKKGQGIIEYALIIAFVVGIASVAFSGENSLGQKVKDTFTNAAKVFDDVSNKNNDTGK